MGGWRWDCTRKEAYANNLDDPEHLLAVKASLNRQKGEKGPEAWKPPRRAEWCAYARAWERIKEHWQFTMTVAERAAVAQMEATCPP